MILWSVELHQSRCYVSYRLESDLVPKLRVYLPASECVTVRHWNMAESEEETNVATSLSSLSVSVSLSLSGLSLLRGARTWWQSGSGLVLPGSEAVRHD